MKPICVVVAIAVLGFATSPSAQVALPPVTATPSDALPVPEWLVWRVFYESLAYYGRSSRVPVEHLLAAQAGMTAAERRALLDDAGPRYVAALAAIDAEARASLVRTYATDRRRPLTPASESLAAPPAGPALAVPAGKTMLDVARETGLYAAVETQKEALLAAHLLELNGALSSSALKRLGMYLQTTVRPTIRRQVARPDRPVRPRVPAAGQ